MTDLNGKKVLVTGGAGFIGSMLVRLLLDAGASVRVVDNFINGKRDNLDTISNKEGLSIHGIDIRETNLVRELLHDIDIVFHLACLGVRHSLHAPLENHDVNATATLNLLQAARAVGVGRFVYTSTSQVYGTAKTVPMPEDHPTYPMTVYGASKLAGECYTRAFYESYGYPTVIVRPFNAFGPRSHHEGDSGEVIPKFMLRAMAGQPMIIFGDGTQTRDFTYVEDTARGILLAGITDEAVGQTINIGSNYEMTVRELAETIKQVVELDDAKIIYDEPRPGDILRLYADSSKAGQLLGFEPQVTFNEGLQNLKDWYDTQANSPEELLKAEKVRNWETK
ncbi:MAG: GDP-mannose 4,6-dehydratase [Phototrophicaceae bacterium]